MSPQQVHGRHVVSATLALMGVSVMAGLLTNHPAWARMVPFSSLAGFNIAILFLMAAVVVWHDLSKPDALTRRAAWCMVLLPALILLETVFELELGIDWVSLHTLYLPDTPHPGRTSPNSALAFMLAGAAVLLDGAQRGFRGRNLVVAVFVYASLSIGLMAMAGYALDLQAMYRFMDYNRMSFPGAVAVVLLGACLWSGLLNRRQPVGMEGEENRITGAAAGVLTMLAAVSGLTAFAVLQQSYKASITDRVRESAASQAMSFAHSLSQDLQSTAVIGSQLLLQRALARLDASARDAEAMAELQAIVESLKSQGFSHVRVDGRQRVGLAEVGGEALSKASVRVPLSAQGATLFWQDGLVLRGETPVMLKGQLLGTVTTEMPLTVLTLLLKELQSLGESTDLLLCGRVDNDAVCFPSRFYKANKHIPIYKDGRPFLPISKALLGQSGAESLPDLRGIEVQAGYAPVGALNLGMVVKTDTGELYAPIRDRLNVVAALLVLFVGFGTWLLRARVHPLALQVAQDQRGMRAILETSHEAFVAIGATGLVTEWNRQAELIFGWTRDEAMGRPMHELIVPPALRAAHLQGMGRFMKTGVGVVIDKRLELTAQRKNGETFPVEITISRTGETGMHCFAAFMHDISQRKADELRLAESEERLRTITDNLPAVITYVDRDYRLRFCNRAFDTWLGVPVEQAVGKRMDEVIPPAILAKRQVWYDRVMQGEQVQFEMESVLRRGPTHMQVTYIPHIGADGTVLGFYSLSMDITARKEVERQLETLARFDALTGLPNRRQFEEQLTQAMARCRRSGRLMAVLFLDVDKFKAINDGMGHAVGDEVLKAFAQRLSSCVRVTDTVARLAGDEFIIILEGMHSSEEPQVVALKILGSMAAPFEVVDQTLNASTSIGIALFKGEDGVSEATLMAQADKALYEAKAAGRATFRCADRLLSAGQAG